MKALQRAVMPRVIDALQSFPVVYINGPRQAGKTTLVKTLLRSRFDAAFITFDDALERAAAMRNPLQYLRASDGPLIIDEVQLVPELFRSLKRLVDERREAALEGRGDPNGRYLLTGSANLNALPALADAMVGRMATLTLPPLSVCELLGRRPQLIERCFTTDFAGIGAIEDIGLTDAIRRSSYPAFLHMNTAAVAPWFDSYVRTITLHDPLQTYRLEKAEYMPLLLQSLAARAGSLINDAELARDVGLSAVTTHTYRGLLNDTFVTHLLRPWYRNITKRLVKSPKLYFYDTMLLCHVLGATPEALQRRQPQRFGHVLENFVLSELMKADHAADSGVDISFYRTNDGREIDFVLERAGKLVAIEVKNAEHVHAKDLSGLKELQQAVGRDFHCGIVLCNAPRVIAFDERIYLVPFAALWQ